MCAFEQAAEILFAGDYFRAGLAGEAIQRFVFHLKPFQPHDADVLSVLFPDLTLAEFHSLVVWESNLSFRIFVSGETTPAAGYLFLPAACLAATADFFSCSALLALACFCEDFFWLDFGDRSPIILFFLRLIHLRYVSFSEGTHILPAGVVIVNDGLRLKGKIRP
jgi:hypothetical protein